LAESWTQEKLRQIHRTDLTGFRIRGPSGHYHPAIIVEAARELVWLCDDEQY
jgi:hypothetical protein